MNCNLNDDYFEWLYSMFGHRPGNNKYEYHILFKTIHRIGFYWLLPNDENRAVDAYELRHQYYNLRQAQTNEELPAFDEVYTGDCTALEVLCALAIRFERDVMHDDGVGDRSIFWFWDMMGNLGFTKMYDGAITQQDQLTVKHRIYEWLDRAYDANGHGGLFPRTNPYLPDQRDLEMWYQMNGYYSEKGIT